MSPLPVSELIRQHHDRCSEMLDALGAAVEGRHWEQCAVRTRALNEALRWHIQFEEETVFPKILGHEHWSDAQVSMLCADHSGLRNLIAALAASSAAHDPRGWGDAFAEFAAMLRRHLEDELDFLPAQCAQIKVAPGDGVTIRPSLQEEARFLDVSMLDPPGPLLRILEELPKADTPLRVRIHRDPLPLYGLLEEGGYLHRTRAMDDGSFEIQIRRAQSPQAGPSGKA